jgi:hypothetical protein
VLVERACPQQFCHCECMPEMHRWLHTCMDIGQSMHSFLSCQISDAHFTRALSLSLSRSLSLSPFLSLSLYLSLSLSLSLFLSFFFVITIAPRRFATRCTSLCASRTYYSLVQQHKPVTHNRLHLHLTVSEALNTQLTVLCIQVLLWMDSTIKSKSACLDVTYKCFHSQFS